MRKNIQALNYSFDKKKEAYQNADNVITGYTLTQDIINNYPTWDINSLIRRQTKLLEKINSIVNIFFKKLQC